MLMTLVAGYTASSSFSALAAFQAQDSINSGNSKLLMLFIGIAAFALLAQAIVVIAVGVGAMKARKEVMREITEIKGKILPLIDKSHGLIVELTPQVRDITAKVGAITAHVEQIAALAKDKAIEFSPTLSAANKTVAAANETVAEANRKTRVQVTRVDGMVSSALDATVRFGVAIERGITAPGREIAGIVSGLKTGLDSLIHGARGFAAGRPAGRPYTTSRPAYPTPTPTHVSEKTTQGVDLPIPASSLAP